MDAQLIEKIKSFPGKKVKYAVTDIDGVLRGKVVHVDKFLSSLECGSGFCDVVLGWDSSDKLYEDSQLTGWHTGYPDGACAIDPESFRTIPWEDGMPFFLGEFTPNTPASQICPRNLLKRVKSRAKAMGLDAVFAQEFEWFNFKETSDELHAKGFQSPEPMTKGMFGYSVLRASQKNDFYSDLFDLLLQFDVPLEAIHTETGPGVYEAAILYDDILEAADRAVLFKTAVKEIARFHGITPTFMAKWSDEYPGCGGHLHQSLWRDGKNIFHDPSDPRGMSDAMRSYIAGMLHCLPHILPMYAPTINSFKRLVEGAWAPTTLTWAVDNRTVAIRALPGGEKSSRLEMRVPASDVNPYLAMAACLASGLYGLKHGLSLEVPETKGNGYRDFNNGTLPNSLREASEKMKSSELARELFGDAFIDHYSMSREWECKEAERAITDWELKRYFEII